MSDMLERLESIKSRIAEVERKKARAEAVKDSASAEMASILASLKTDYGLGTVAEIKERMASLSEEIEAEVARAEEILDGIDS